MVIEDVMIETETTGLAPEVHRRCSRRRRRTAARSVGKTVSGLDAGPWWGRAAAVATLDVKNHRAAAPQVAMCRHGVVVARMRGRPGDGLSTLGPPGIGASRGAP